MSDLDEARPLDAEGPVRWLREQWERRVERPVHEVSEEQLPEVEPQETAETVEWARDPRNLEQHRYLETSQAALQELRERARTFGPTDVRTLRAINPPDGFPQKYRQYNCAETTRATIETFEGRPRVARPMTTSKPDGTEQLGESVDHMETWAHRPHDLRDNWHGRWEIRASDSDLDKVEPDVEAGFTELERQLRQEGDGASRAVFVAWKPNGTLADGTALPPDTILEHDSAHWFTAVNEGGRVLFLDGQSGERWEPGTEDHRVWKATTLGVSWVKTNGRGA